MNRNKFLYYVSEYKKHIYELNNQRENADLVERKERISYYQSFNKNTFMDMSEEQFQDYIAKTWASRTWGNKQYIIDLMLSSNGGLEKTKKLIFDFLFGKDDFEKRWKTFINNANYFGPSYMSELLAYIEPSIYALANRQVITALEELGYTDLPHYNYQFTASKYLRICELVKEIGKELEKESIKTENLLAVDYFLWEVAMGLEPYPKKTEEVISGKIIKDNTDFVFVHNDIKEMVVKIGRLLGFESRSEYKVGTGAVLDAVWTANIGNMGRISYVFEVQTKGSIDSLILNLQKAKKKKTVQAVVAISNLEQLEKIKMESVDIDINIIPWNYIDVIKVYDQLTSAFETLNSLDLIPKDF